MARDFKAEATARAKREQEDRRQRRAEAKFDPERPTFDLVVRQNAEKLTIVIMHVNALRAELVGLREDLRESQAALRQSNQLVLRLLEEPEARHHAEAMIRDYFHTRPEATPK